MPKRIQDDIHELIREGHDPVAVQLSCELLDFSGQANRRQRVQRLLTLGDRYIALALLQEDGESEDQQLASLLERRTSRHMFFLPDTLSALQCDDKALSWYQEAVDTSSPS
jgi:hypothetical protein